MSIFKIRRRIKLWNELLAEVRYFTFGRFFRHAIPLETENQKRFLYTITTKYHAIEKSLAMPDFEPGHAQDKLADLIRDLNRYRDLGFDTGHTQYIAALQAIQEFDFKHKKKNVSLPQALQSSIDQLLESYGKPIEMHCQPSSTREEFFAHADDNFSEFARSRHSTRAFSDEEVPLELVSSAIDLARTTPTACNRQPAKTYVVCDPTKINTIISWQGGGRGFAERANKLLIVTSRVDAFAIHEYNEVWKNGGMYAMNLLYALHYHKIGACPLIWNSRIEQDRNIHRLLMIPDDEEVILLIAIGYPLQAFRYVQSARNPLSESLQIVK